MTNISLAWHMNLRPDSVDSHVLLELQRKNGILRFRSESTMEMVPTQPKKKLILNRYYASERNNNDFPTLSQVGVNWRGIRRVRFHRDETGM